MRLLALITLAALAVGCKSEDPAPVASVPPGKQVIFLDSVQSVKIDLPTGEVHEFGKDFEASLATDLTVGGKFIVVTPRTGARYEWENPSATPVGNLKVVVETLSFTTGARGERMFYGFNERLRTPYNDGTGARANEFPLRAVEFEPNWFDRHFDAKGKEPFDSRAGLDLGEGFSIDVLFAWFKLKYAQYRAEIGLRLQIDSPLLGYKEERLVNVTGQGFYYDLAGAYQQYSGQIAIARRDAMNRAFRNAIQGSVGAIERAFVDLPLVARIDGLVEADGVILLGTGRGANVKPGTIYEVAETGTRIEVVENSKSGAVARVSQGEFNSLKVGMLAKEQRRVARIASRLSARAELAAVENIELPWTDLPKSDLKYDEISKWEAARQALVGTALLAYRAWRYYHYDRAYNAEPDGVDPTSEEERQDQQGVELAKPHQSSQRADGPVVAVIDTGVDYNHPAIHANLWRESDEIGWDFISNDARPHDDAYHGTQVASVILSVAPNARIMALKAFNAWGVSSSAALHGSIRYAVDHGAQVIVCAWATRRHSEALKTAIVYARERGVPVVAAAGDRGEDLARVPAFPAALSRELDNVLTVASTDEAGALVTVRGRFSNYGAGYVQLAAPAQDLAVAEPRARKGKDTSTALAAARVAGALAREIESGSGHDYRDWFASLRARAIRVPALAGKVRDGLIR